jgi:hypothetical protein
LYTKWRTPKKLISMPRLLAATYADSGRAFIGPSNQPYTPCVSRLNPTSATAVARMLTAVNLAPSLASLVFLPTRKP